MKQIKVIRDVMEEGKNQADLNRRRFRDSSVVCVNIMGAPGCGKTTLIENFIKGWGPDVRIGVIEGDYEGVIDSERIGRLGIPVVQINARSCHLTPSFVGEAMDRISLEQLDFVFIENVGNLICPASHYLGEDVKIVLLSVPEGDDKLEKYPKMFSIADLVVITKSDLLPYIEFSIDKVRHQLRKINRSAKLLDFNVKEPEKISAMIEFLSSRRSKFEGEST